MYAYAGRMPITFHPSRLAPLTALHPGLSLGSISRLLDGGYEPDPVSRERM
jgi:hypothetical protein